jgi:hypothetical protein
MSLEAPNSTFYNRIVHNSGTATFGGTGTFFLGGGAIINNSGVFDIQTDATISGAFASTGTEAINNTGTFRKSAGTDPFEGARLTSLAFNNSGTVEALSGSLAFSSYTQTAGSTRLGGGAIEGNLNIQGGSLTGSGTVFGNVTSGGNIAPGASAGTLSITGSLTLNPGASVTSELGGTVQGTGYDTVSVGGSLSLNGNLNVSFIGGFENTVTSGGMFILLDAGSISGAFANVANGARLTTTDGLGSFEVNYGPSSPFDQTQVILRDFLAVPEPHQYLVAVGLGLVSFAASRRLWTLRPSSNS